MKITLEANRETCRTCRYWEAERLEPSGLWLADGSAEWEYPVGPCQNAHSVHGGWSPPGYPPTSPSVFPSWNSCWCHKRRTGKSA